MRDALKRGYESLKHLLVFNHHLRIEPSILVVVLGISGAIWGFALLAEVMLEGRTQGFDEAILLAMRVPGDLSDPIGPEWIEEMGRDYTALGGSAVLTLVVLAVIGYLLMIRRPRVALTLFIVTLGAVLTSNLLKYGIDRPRPELVPHGAVVYTKSFPSGHSMQAAATWLTLAALLARVQRRRRVGAFIIGVAACVTVLVGVSRVYLGVHWPTDVLAGWTLGAAWALFAWLLVRWLQEHGQVEPEVSEDETDAQPAPG